VALHRIAVGSLNMGELLPGSWRVLTSEERVSLTG
jgi:16S rRNA U516 pseudouridylate synthase RsuA-like enzyme